MNDTLLFCLYKIFYIYCSSRRIGHLSACFPCHGKTRVNGGRQKAKTAGVLMNLSRLRQLGPQQFTKKTEKGWEDKPFLIIFVHHDIISSTSTFSHVVLYLLGSFFFFFFGHHSQLATSTLIMLLWFGPNIMSSRLLLLMQLEKNMN